MVSDTDKFLEEFDQSVEWFCSKINEPVPLTPADCDKIYNRMKNLGWIRQSEIELYKELTKPEDD
jgi:hypothetical protein